MSLFLEILATIFAVLYVVLRFLISLWWIYIPLFLGALAWSLWIRYIRNKFIQGIEWVILEIKPPKDIQKTAKAMEQFFAGLHGIAGTPNWWGINMKGMFQRWISLEMISQGGEIHFLIKAPSMYRDLIEAHIYAQYPETEIVLTDDYVYSVPKDIFEEDYDLYGAELMLTKEDAYPIRTYLDFDKGILVDEHRIDPVASLLEAMNKLKEGEHIWIQTLVRPIGDKWKEEGDKLRDELVGRAKEKKQGEIAKEVSAWKDAGRDVAREIVTGEAVEGGSGGDSKEEKKYLDFMTKIERGIITAVEENVSKIGFETIIRYIYFAKKDIFQSTKPTVVGSYKQFNTQHLNGFKENNDTKPGIDYWWEFKKIRNAYRKRRILADYRKRDFVEHSKYISYLKPLFFERMPIVNWYFFRSKPFVFNIEELASVYHFPAMAVKAPLTPKVEAKKSEPPIGLPIE